MSEKQQQQKEIKNKQMRCYCVKLNEYKALLVEAIYLSLYYCIDQLLLLFKMRKELVFLPSDMELDIVNTPCSRYKASKCRYAIQTSPTVDIILP